MSEHIQDSDNNKDFSAEESLQLITSMINKTKNAVAVDSFYFLFWGWLVFVSCVAQYLLIELEIRNSHYVWITMPLGGVVSAFYSIRVTRNARTKTFLDEALSFIWIALAIAFFVLVYIHMVAGTWENSFTYYILLYGVGTLASGQLLRFKPLIIGGIINFALALACVHFTYKYQLLFGAAAIFTSYVIPGHLIRNMYRKKSEQHG